VRILRSAFGIWEDEDSQSHHDDWSSSSKRTKLYNPKATLSRSTPSSHTHALTSISIYPFDPVPSTLLTTSYDKTLKVTSITPEQPGSITHLRTRLHTVHAFAIPASGFSTAHRGGTAHPAIRLLDLRSGLATHSMTGPNGAVYSIAWSPRASHILASGSSDGRVLFFDIRRAQRGIRISGPRRRRRRGRHSPSLGHDARRELLDFNAVAHNGPVTGVQWTPSGDKIVTAGHDQRIRVWGRRDGPQRPRAFRPEDQERPPW